MNNVHFVSIDKDFCIMRQYFTIMICLLGLVTITFSCKTKQLTHLPHTSTTEKSEQKFIEQYSARLGIPLEKGCNQALIRSIDRWLGTPYAYGGNNTNGTDCSGLVQNIYKEVYGFQVERSSVGIWKQSQVINKEDLTEGDLVFFKINTPKVGHVGLYIGHGYFVHASTKKGVIISHLDEKYYHQYYFSAGRISR